MDIWRAWMSFSVQRESDHIESRTTSRWADCGAGETFRWTRTTTLVWTIWFCASFAYTIFNVFLPRFLEQKVGAQPGAGALEESLKDCE